MRLPVTLPIRRSRALAAALLVVHGSAAVGVVPVALPFAGKLLLWFGLAASLARTLRRPSATGLTLGADGHVTLIRGDGSLTECQVEHATTVFPWLIVLRARHAHGAETLTLPIDALGADGHRRMRLWLKWRATTWTA
jgi:toxin CptA